MDNKNDEKLLWKLEEYEVHVPDFPMRKSQMDRAANWLFNPVPLPVFEFQLSKKGTALTVFFPILISVISAIPLLFL